MANKLMYISNDDTQINSFSRTSKLFLWEKNGKKSWNLKKFSLQIFFLRKKRKKNKNDKIQKNIQHLR